jgi:EAL domain-containing protein (putative c-di-GMP-specific phosphodiesterase class I)
VTCVRPEDTVARTGGDEFAVLIEDIRDVSDASRVALRIHEAMAAPFDLTGLDVGIREVFGSVSVGIAMSATGYAQPEHVLQDAETAMYRAKSLGGARAEVFDDAMRTRVQARLQVESDLRRAVERGQFELYYQPILSLAAGGTGGILGFEALVRWRHPERGLMLPEEFIAVAEETGMILPLGVEVLRRACRQMQLWTGRSPEAPLVVSVNISGRQLAEGDFPERVAEVLRETGLPPRRLKLEITESAIIENAEAAAGQLHRLRDLGVGIWLDDFGSGHASFAHLHRFPIETLKIDRSFVAGLEEADGSREITRTIVLLAHSLGMSAIAEGVERPEQQDRLRDLRCDAVQGYLLGHPLTQESAEELLAGLPV